MTLSRKEFYEKYKDTFKWYDTEQYACYDVLTVSPQTVENVKQTASKVWQILLQAGEVMKTLDDSTLLEFGYPPETFRLIRSTTQPPFIARCDFAVTDDNIYLLECNAEVATFVVETFKINGIVANHFGKEDPNKRAEKILKHELNKYLTVAANYIGKSPKDCHIIFAALSQADEDIGTVEYLRSLCFYESAFCPIESITMDDKRIYDRADRPVDIIYRLYPTEWMVEDKDPNLGVSLWDYLEPLVFSRKAALINPISSFVIQNKSLMALITQLGLKFFGEGSLTVCSHFLPTFITESKIRPPFVSKPTWGREGKEIKIFKTKKEVIYNPSAEYSNLPKVYQKYVDLPTVNVEGKTYNLQFSCFLINGIAVGVAARVGEKILNNTSIFLPIGY